MAENSDLNSDAFVSGPFSDPFRDWPNSDLLIDEGDRAFFARHFPAFAPILDWPELRLLFSKYDKLARSARARSRRWGIGAIAAGFSSLALAALIPITGGKVQAALGGTAATLAIVSVLAGYTQLLTGKEKARWLKNRFWTERIRQFHFQLILNNLPVVLASVGHPTDLSKWHVLRAQELDRFEHEYLRDVEDKIHHLTVDEAEDDPWIFEDWEHPAAVPEASSQLEVFLKIMKQQRLGIQQRYAERKMSNGWHSPDTQAQRILHLSDTFTILLLIATITAGCGSVIALTLNKAPHLHLYAAVAATCASATIVAMRALKEGLLISADAERYRWYSAAIRTLNRRYELADTAKKVLLLRDFERVAYQEMRRFMLAGSHARFVI